MHLYPEEILYPDETLHPEEILYPEDILYPEVILHVKVTAISVALGDAYQTETDYFTGCGRGECSRVVKVWEFRLRAA